MYTSGCEDVRHKGVKRLFADARGEEERYFAATGIFRVMHVVVLRREVYEKRKWLEK